MKKEEKHKINTAIIKPRPFAEYAKGLTEDEKRELREYISDVTEHLIITRRDREAILYDFEKAFLYYRSVNIGFEEAKSLLDARNLGGFYCRPPMKWYPLDTAAKVYPLSMKTDRMAVFRLAAYLDCDIAPELLQMALTFTVKRFPSFATTVKKGVFWHYLNSSKCRYPIYPDVDMPCRPMKIAGSEAFPFRVLYYQNRISVEYFHILTDGSGGLEFIKVLLAEYLRLTGVVIPKSDLVMDINATPDEAETENAFLHAETTTKASGFMDKPATQMSGKISRIRPCRVIHFKMDADKLNEVAKSKNGTVTSYLLSLMFAAGKSATEDDTGVMNIQVPFNMRKYHPSKTIRNFSLYCGIKFPIESIKSRDDLIPEIKEQLAQKTSRDAMREMTTSSLRIVSGCRYIPLFIKAPFVRFGYGFIGDTVFSNTLSNIGIVNLPDGMKEHIQSMDFVLGTVITNRACCSLITVNGVATFTISKLTTDPTFEEKMYEYLESDGIEVKAEGTVIYES